MYPIKQQITGTGTTTAVFPDIYQNPFQVGIGVQLQTGGGLTTAIIGIEHCFDYRCVMSPSFNGATALVDGAVVTAVWFPNSGTVTAGVSGTTITASIGTGFGTASYNYAFAVAAMRLNIISATATAITIVEWIQSVNSP